MVLGVPILKHFRVIAIIPYWGFIEICYFLCLCRDLGDNLIQYIPTALSGSGAPSAIETLILNNNKLTFLEASAFINLTALTQL